MKQDGKWFVLLSAEQAQNGSQHGAEQLNQSAEQELEAAEQRYVDLLEAQNERLWKELEERRREVSELHILLRREQERGDTRQLAPPVDYVVSVQPTQNTVDQQMNKRRPWWKRFTH